MQLKCDSVQVAANLSRRRLLYTGQSNVTLNIFKSYYKEFRYHFGDAIIISFFTSSDWQNTQMEKNMEKQLTNMRNSRAYNVRCINAINSMGDGNDEIHLFFGNTLAKHILTIVYNFWVRRLDDFEESVYHRVKTYIRARKHLSCMQMKVGSCVVEVIALIV